MHLWTRDTDYDIIMIAPSYVVVMNKHALTIFVKSNMNNFKQELNTAPPGEFSTIGRRRDSIC